MAAMKRKQERASRKRKADDAFVDDDDWVSLLPPFPSLSCVQARHRRNRGLVTLRYLQGEDTQATAADDDVPTRDELLSGASRDRGLPRPLLCVVMGHVKNWAFSKALESGLPDNPANGWFLDTYFPRRLQAGFQPHFTKHPLRREIIATAAVNYLVNKAGVRFIPAAMAATGQDVGAVMQAYLDVDREAGGQSARDQVLASGLSPEQEYAALVEIETALARAARARLEGRPEDAAPLLKKLGGVPAGA